MNKSRSVVKNTGAMLLGTIIRMSASLVLVVFVGRRLGPKGMGEFSLILTLFWIFQTMASMGIQPLLIREVAKDKEKTGSILTNASILAFVVSLIMSGFMTGFSHIMGYSVVIRQATLWMGAALIIATISLVFQSIFIAWEKVELVLLGMTWENAVRLAVGILVLIRGGEVVAIAAVFALASFVNLIVNIVLTRKYITCIHMKIDLKICTWLAKLIPTFAGISIFSTLYWNMDMLLLSRLVTIDEVGYYSAPMRLVNVIKLILQSYKVAIQPVAARMFSESREEFQKFCEKSLFYVFLFTIPVCMGVLILAKPVIMLVFGDTFLQSTLIFRVGVWMLIPYGAVLVFASFLIASHNQHIDLRINIISMFIAYGSGYLLIIRQGALGAAIALVLSLIVFVLQQVIFIRRNLFVVNFWHLTYKMFLASLIMGVSVYFLRELNMFITILIGCIVYFGILSVLGLISLKDIRYLSEMRHSKKTIP